MAEVLVTLAVIGIVSAMTVPSLMQNHQRKTYVTQLHKFYNIMTQALRRYQNDRNAVSPSEAGLSSQQAIDDFMYKYFNVVQSCDNFARPCFADTYTTYGTRAKVDLSKNTGFKSYVLADGSAAALKYTWSISSPNKLIRVYVDINGQSGPNVYGRDFFGMYIYANGLIDISSNSSKNAPLTVEQRKEVTGYCGNGASLDACFGRILNDNWEMNY